MIYSIVTLIVRYVDFTPKFPYFRVIAFPIAFALCYSFFYIIRICYYWWQVKCNFCGHGLPFIHDSLLFLQVAIPSNGSNSSLEDCLRLHFKEQTTDKCVKCVYDTHLSLCSSKVWHLSFPWRCTRTGGVIQDTSILPAPKILVVVLKIFLVRESPLLFFIYYNYLNLNFTWFSECWPKNRNNCWTS